MKCFYSSVHKIFLLGLSFCLPYQLIAGSTGTVRVTGNVPILCELSVQQEPDAVNISDISAGHNNRHIATVTENCNSPSGYTVTLSAANTGNHTGQFVDTISQDKHPFTIAYNGISVAPGGVVTDASTMAFDVQKKVDITYPADSTLTGTITPSYEETLTFTISAK